jgi:hypothetical protein
VSFAAITLCVTCQLVFIVYFVMTQSGNFWIHPRISQLSLRKTEDNRESYVRIPNGLAEVRIGHVMNTHKTSYRCTIR